MPTLTQLLIKSAHSLKFPQKVIGELALNSVVAGSRKHKIYLKQLDSLSNQHKNLSDIKQLCCDPTLSQRNIQQKSKQINANVINSSLRLIWLSIKAHPLITALAIIFFPISITAIIVFLMRQKKVQEQHRENFNKGNSTNNGDEAYLDYLMKELKSSLDESVKEHNPSKTQ